MTGMRTRCQPLVAAGFVVLALTGCGVADPASLPTPSAGPTVPSGTETPSATPSAEQGSYAPLLALRDPSEVTALALRADGRVVASAGRDAKVRLRDLANPGNPTVTATIDLHQPGSTAATRLTFSPDGTLLAVATAEVAVHLYDVSDWHRPVHLATIDGGPGGEVAFSPDGLVLGTAAGAPDQPTPTLWSLRNPSTPAPLATLATDHASGVTFAGDHVLTGHRDRVARLWNIADPARPVLLGSIPDLRPGPYGVAVTRSARTVAVCLDTGIQLYDITDPGRPLARGSLPEAAGTFAAFSPDGVLLAVAGPDTTVLYDVSNPAVPRAVASLMGGRHIGFDADGTLLAVARGTDVLVYATAPARAAQS